MKKIILSFTVFVVIIYLLLCYGINKWIDNQETGDDLFRVEQDTTNLDIAKLIWQITPAFDKEKDAERALKISQLYIASLSVYSYNEKMIKSLKNNYHFISTYQN
ncbi:MAG: hypothetical protein II131_04620, partial [Neisseriaceae bacterium]|nr:hypothetical protein [Neisseriaceae bacterium]